MIDTPPGSARADAQRPPMRHGHLRHAGIVLLAIALATVAAVADAEFARDLVIVAAVAAALAVIVDRLNPVAEAPAKANPAAAQPPADPDARAHFLTLAAHEIRTPLTGILGLADLLGETNLTAEQTAYVRALRSSGTALLGLVDGYLDLSRLEAGHVEPRPVPTALEAVVEEVVELLAPPCQAKGLELVGHVAASASAPVAVDPLLLRQVLINLAGNAVKFTETGGVAIEVERVEKGVLFRVRDTGIGIDPAEASRIFDAWARVEAEGEPARGGTGLGLAIARGIVDSMGGRIALASRPGEGSTFSFVLDLPAVGPAAQPERPLRGRRVALVSRAGVEPPLLVRRLHALGAEAWLVEDVAALGGRDGFDVVLVDAHGGVDPAAVLEDLRASGIAAPAVVMVPPSGRSALPGLRAAGFAAHLVRPVRAASLVRVVALAVEDRGRAAVRPSAPPASGFDVLLVDDNEINALLGRAALEHAGHRVTVAGEGAAAVDCAERARAEGHPFDVVLMDLHMPGLDGFAAIRALRAAEPEEGPRALVVALTADATPAAAERAAAAGADATMVKPIDRDRLAALFDRRLEASSKGRRAAG